MRRLGVAAVFAAWFSATEAQAQPEDDAAKAAAPDGEPGAAERDDGDGGRASEDDASGDEASGDEASGDEASGDDEADEVQVGDDVGREAIDALPPPDALAVVQRKAVADRLFAQAHEALEADDWKRACMRFRASMRYDVSVSTQLNIARCHEREGKLVEAWEDYNRARLLNRDTDDAERRQQLADYMTEHVGALEERLPRLRVIVPQPPDDLVVSSDGLPLGKLAAGEPVPLNPGAHVIEVRAPGYEPEQREIRLEEGKLREIVVPLDEPAEPEPAPAPTPSPAPAPAPPMSAAPDAADDGTAVWVWPVGALGLAAAATSIGVLVDAGGARSELADTCTETGGRFECPDTQLTQDDLDALVQRSNVGLGVGVGLAVVGAGGLVAAIAGLASDGTDEKVEALTVAPYAGPRAAGVTGRWRF